MPLALCREITRINGGTIQQAFLLTKRKRHTHVFSMPAVKEVTRHKINVNQQFYGIVILRLKNLCSSFNFAMRVLKCQR